LEKLRLGWERALADNLSVQEMKERVALLAPGARAMIEKFLAARALPNPVASEFVKALNDLLGGFEVRRVTSEELWGGLFPDRSPVTISDLRNRFTEMLETLRQGAMEEKVRVVPAEKEGQ
jgi:hypothetical protein